MGARVHGSNRFRHFGEKHRPKDRDANHAAALTQEHGRRCRYPDLFHRRCALRDHVEQALRRAKANAQNEEAPDHVKLARARIQPRHQEYADKLQAGADQHDALVLARARHIAAGQGRSHDEANHQRQQQQTAIGRLKSETQLKVERQVDNRAHERHRDYERGDGRGGERSDLEQVQRQDGLGVLRFDVDEDRAGDDCEREQHQDVLMQPAFLISPGHGEHDGANREHDKNAAKPVDLAAAGMSEVRHLQRDHRQRDYRGRQVDVETPAPPIDVDTGNRCRAVVRKVTTHDGADDAGQAKYRAEHARIFRAFPRREEVGDGGEGGGEQRASAHALDAAEDDELHHAVAAELARQAAQPGPCDKDEDSDDQDQLAAIEVAELAPDGHHDGRGQEVAGGDPGIEFQPVELLDDGRHGGRHDGLVERAQQENDDQGPESKPFFLRGGFTPVGKVMGRARVHVRAPSTMRNLQVSTAITRRPHESPRGVTSLTRKIPAPARI